MPSDWTAYVTAGASVASVLVAILAVAVAWRASTIADRSAEIAHESVQTARRQVALAGIPYLVASRPEYRSGRLNIPIRNTGAVPALGIIADVRGAAQRFVPQDATLRKSGAHANLSPQTPVIIPIGIDEGLRTADPGGAWHYPFLVIRLRYHGPQGGSVVHSYDWDTAKRWRLRTLDIDPADSGDPIRIELPL